jgi:hypothetical protein
MGRRHGNGKEREERGKSEIGVKKGGEGEMWLGVRRGRNGGKGNRRSKKGMGRGDGKRSKEKQERGEKGTGVKEGLWWRRKKRKGGRNRSKRGDCRGKDMGIGVSKRRNKMRWLECKERKERGRGTGGMVGRRWKYGNGSKERRRNRRNGRKKMKIWEWE